MRTFDVDGRVVELAPVRDLFLQGEDALQQVHEDFARAKLPAALGHREQPRHACERASSAVSRGAPRSLVWARVRSSVTFSSSPLVSHIPLHRIDSAWAVRHAAA